jgi:hypothetical protein
MYYVWCFNYCLNKYHLPSSVHIWQNTFQEGFALKNIGLWWRYGISRHCDEWKYIIIGRIFESEIILIPPSLKISESSSNGSYRNTDEVPRYWGREADSPEICRLDKFKQNGQCNCSPTSKDILWRINRYKYSSFW